jgi:hypothetical protein
MLNGDDIWHVHPPFWWSGMKGPELQILLHGDCIGVAEVELYGADNVKLNDAVRFDNPNYVLLYLDVADAPLRRLKLF